MVNDKPRSRRLNRIRFSWYAIVLCGAPEVGFEASGARVERVEIAVLFDQPVSMVGTCLN